eukprot:TRINITY_DN2770_c0_g2_i8.p1 TRINITY_DN2770_c0_g2~~TRINITY_DN2770_c0_g2_i8.p1  ORF type:complete len:487 (-),score=135.62 TRINITY_DN2770_c0_g2_i8:103-1563(-)
MVTGDNPLTAVTVARECELVDADSCVFLGHLVQPADPSQPLSEIEWRNTDDPRWTLNSYTLLPNPPPADCEVPKDKQARYELAVTGDLFGHLSTHHHHPFATVNSSSSSSSSSSVSSALSAPLLTEEEGEKKEVGPLVDTYFRRVILACQVFARMTPAQKAQLIAECQAMGLYVGMCGDGANDCGALKTAHVGVSLSESEASIAAPFTYSRPNISCIPILLCEGRASLITSFQLFRFMAMYSMTQFSATILLYFKGTTFGDWQFLMQDLFVVFPLTIFMGNTYATHKLSAKRPSGNLLSFKNVASILTHIFICFTFQLIVYLFASHQQAYVDLSNQDEGPVTWETTSVFYLLLFQYIIMALLFSLGWPWKRPIYSNRRFSFWIVVCILSSLSYILWSNNKIFFWKDDVMLPTSWRLSLLFMVGVNTAANAVFELVLIPFFVFLFQQVRSIHSGSSVLGSGKCAAEGGKIYHDLRRAFEKGWSRKID